MTMIDEAPRTGNPDYPQAPGDPHRVWESYEHLRSELPEWTTPIEMVAPGQWIRRVKEHTGEIVEDERGQLCAQVIYVPRRVALSIEAARTANDGKHAWTPTDFWDGWTWWRDGIKPERDMRVEGAKVARDVEYTLEPLTPVESAVHDARRRTRRARVAEASGFATKE